MSKDKDNIIEIFDSLTDREKLVIKERFGLIEVNPKTISELGNQFDITRERIKEIEEKALKKLNRNNDPEPG